jgi:ABC-type nickel/cobalt efflux system permease component RcnA
MVYSNISLTMAFFLGALHAFWPGHGKAVMAAYLVGSRGRVIDAIWLGIIIAVTHTFSVIALGILIKIAYGAVMEAVIRQQNDPNAEPIPIPGAKIMQLVAGFLILGVGIWLIISRKRFIEHQHISPDRISRQGTLQFIILGISGGMIPCAEGIALLLLAIAAGQIGRGLTLVIAFSSGVAIIIVSIGIIISKLTVIAENLLKKTGQWVTKLPILSGLLISSMGLYSIVRVLMNV